MFAKEPASRRELEELLLARCRATMDITSVTVIGAGPNWHATFSAKSHLMVAYVPRFHAVVSDVQARYDVKD